MFGNWGQEDQDYKARFSYIVSLRVVWTTGDPDKTKQKHRRVKAIRSYKLTPLGEARFYRKCKNTFMPHLPSYNQQPSSTATTESSLSRFFQYQMTAALALPLHRYSLT